MTDVEPRPLHLHTIESLCADLISGRAVGLGDGNTFELPAPEARAVLNWYFGRRSKWHSRMSEADAESVAAATSIAPPSLPSIAAPNPTQKKRFKLARVRAHRFGGIHGYGSQESPPEDFTFAPDCDITLLEGSNGSGKTSFLNATIWCLTGSLLRAQRPPSEGAEEFSCEVDGAAEGSGLAVVSRHDLTPVTPLPDVAKYKPKPGEPVPADTWVEVTLKDEAGVEYPPLRRTQSRKPNGKLEERGPDVSALGIDPISFRIGTIMPALLQHIQIGAESDLGKAVSELTGLADLTTLKDHAARAQNYLATTASKKRQGDIAAADARFLQARGDLAERITEYPAMAPPSPLPTPSESETIEPALESLKAHFEGRKAEVLKAAQETLGQSFDPEDESARNDLVSNIGPARGELGKLSLLPSAARLRGLSRLSGSEKQTATKLIARIWEEAESLATLAAEPEVAKREQLYAHVAAWMAANGVEDPALCHVCSRPASDVVDPITGKAFTLHITAALEADAELLSQTVSSWAKSRLAQLARDLPEPLASERNRDLPSDPRELLRAALVDELFAASPFKGVLGALRQAHEALCEKELDALPPFEQPALQQLPATIKADAAELGAALDRIEIALQFGSWRNDNKDAIDPALKKLLGRSGAAPDDAVDEDDESLTAKLSSLDAIVEGSAPIRVAIDLCARMGDALSARRIQEKRLATYSRAVVALEEIKTLGGLAAAQVEQLQKVLGARSRSWRDSIYMDAVTSSHQLRKTRMSAEGVLEFQVGSEDITAPAQHVSNASALRASLVGFFFAFRDQVLRERGGLALLILDDPQELLDQHNREKMAMALVQLAGKRTQLLITTHDRRFAEIVAEEGASKRCVDHRSVHPVNAQRDTLELAPSKRQVDEKAEVFEKDQDNHGAAREYANAVRIYLETRLRDLFDDPSYPAYASGTTKPTFGDHLGHLRGLVANKVNELFEHPLVAGFANDPRLQAGSECYRLLNDAHHEPDKITYARVSAVAADLKALRKRAEDMHAAFRDWRWRNKLPLAAANDNPVALKSVTAPAFSCAVCSDLAAFTGTGSPGGSQSEEEEILSGDWFADKALFRMRTDNLGLALPAGSVAIVEASPSDGRDRNLVIARRKGETLARRLFRHSESNRWALAAETPDPRKSPPTRIVTDGEFAIHRIVGCLLVDAVAPTSSQEAVQLEVEGVIPKFEAAYRLQKESAVPFALPGQMLLGGPAILPNEYDKYEGGLAALILDDGSRVLKRIGARISSKFGFLRHFETIGGLGGSTLLQTEEIDDTPFDAPVIVSARLALGVIYEI